MRTQGRKFGVAAALAMALAPALTSARPDEDESALRLRGAYVLAGGGVTNFTHPGARDRVDPGGTWDVRLGIGQRFFAGGEFAYVGSAHSGGGLRSTVQSNGFEAVLRLQYPWERGRWFVEPFAFGGIGWIHFNRDGARDMALEDTVLPIGAGVTVGWDRFLVDARFTFRRAFDSEILRAPDGSKASLDTWALTAGVGYAF